MQKSVSHLSQHQYIKGGAGAKSIVWETREQVVMCGAPIAKIKFPQSSQLTISLEQRR